MPLLAITLVILLGYFSWLLTIYFKRLQLLKLIICGLVVFKKLQIMTTTIIQVLIDYHQIWVTNNSSCNCPIMASHNVKHYHDSVHHLEYNLVAKLRMASSGLICNFASYIDLSLEAVWYFTLFFPAINPLIFKTGSKTSFPANTSSTHLRNLAPHTLYRVTVSAHNSAGSSRDVSIEGMTLTSEGESSATESILHVL